MPKERPLHWIDPNCNAPDLVSVIIPAYNRAALIGETIESVYAQSYRPIEVIVIDDGSEDDLSEVINEISSKLKSEKFLINYYRQNNSGAPSARNHGIRMANGGYIQFLDSDDELESNKLNSQVTYLLKNPELDIVYGDWKQGTKDDFIFVKGERYDDLLEQFYGKRVITNFSFLFKRNIVSKIGPWDEELKRNQEIDYQIRAVLEGAEIGYLPEITGLWFFHDGDRIASSSGAIRALEFHDKWHHEFKQRGLLTTERKKVVSDYYFWYAMKLPSDLRKSALTYLRASYDLNQDRKEFNTRKFKLIKSFLGLNSSLSLWYDRARSNSKDNVDG